jgi:hypothetical protein
MDHIVAVVIIGRNGIFLNAFIKVKTLILWGFLGTFGRHRIVYTLHSSDMGEFYGPKSPPYSTY